MPILQCVIAACVCIACLSLAPTEASACSCVDWSRVGDAQGRQAFLEDWARAEAAVSGRVLTTSDLETQVRVTTLLKGQAPANLRLFPRPPEPKLQQHGDAIVMELGPDCRPALKAQTEYLILLFRGDRGTLDGERCAVWAGTDREQRLGWIPPGSP